MNRQTVAQTQKQTMTSPPVAGGLMQRKCACGQHKIAGGECEECRKKQMKLQRSANNGFEPTSVPPIVHEVLRTPGQPLDPATRAFMEPRFGLDFSQVQARTTPQLAQSGPTVDQPNDRFEREADSVAETVMRTPLPLSAQSAGSDLSQIRIHTDARAAESARALNALAYTVGRDIVFGVGQYTPETPHGKKLLAHELAHTIQQTTDNSGLLIQRMAECPSRLTASDPVPPGWKPYQGDPCVFHCCYTGILENRRPTPEDPQNECFYDETGTLVDENHQFAGCRGTPNQYDSASDPIKHALIDSGGIVRSGWRAFWTSREYAASSRSTRCEPRYLGSGAYLGEDCIIRQGPGPKL